jgi:chromosome partitioning protein
MRAAEGRDVLIIDADRQGSASYWAEKRSDRHADLPAVQSVQKFGEGLMRTVRDMARRYHDILIDAGAGDTREVESSLSVWLSKSSSLYNRQALMSGHSG